MAKLLYLLQLSWTAHYTATLQITFMGMWSPPPSQIGYVCTALSERLLRAHILMYTSAHTL